MTVQTQDQFLQPNLSFGSMQSLDHARAGAGARLRPLAQAIRRVDPAVALPAAIVLVMLACAAAPAWIAPFTPTDMDHDAILQAPGLLHPMGTDHLGRDVLSLVVYGARQSLLLGAGAVAVGVLLGGSIGLIAGYAGRTIDMALMRVTDIWMSVPDILLIIAIATALTPSLTNMILTIGLVSAPRYARVMRSQVIAIKSQPYIDAARAIGASHRSILLRHILPHTISTMLVMVTLGISLAVLMGASLSFIGLGVVDDAPDWGYLLSQGRSYLTVAWWFGAFPGLAITGLVISVNLLGDALRHRLDPRARAQ